MRLRSYRNAVALQLKSAHNHCVSEFQFGGEFVWWPSPELIAKSNLQQFIEKHRLGSYDELMRRSTTDIAWFWDTVLARSRYSVLQTVLARR